MYQKGNILIGVLIGLLIAGGLLGAYYLGTSKNSKPQPQNPIIASTPQPTPITTTKERWQKYENETLLAGLSIQYPPDWTVNYRKEYDRSSDYTAKYRLTFDFAPPGWNPDEWAAPGSDWQGWGRISFDVYAPQKDINQWLSMYEKRELGIYKNKLIAKEQTEIGNKPTFFVSVNPQYSGQIYWRSRVVILGSNYSYELTTSEGYFKNATDNFRTVLEDKIYPGIKIN